VVLGWIRSAWFDMGFYSQGLTFFNLVLGFIVAGGGVVGSSCSGPL